jgi:stage V sporulation protein K
MNQFGNARLARNGFEKTIENQATRIAAEKNMTDEVLRTIVVADLPTSEDLDPGPVALDIRP